MTLPTLQESLESLSPTTWTDVPSTDPAALRAYITDLRTKAHLIVDSVPLPSDDDIQAQQAAYGGHPASKVVRASGAVPVHDLVDHDNGNNGDSSSGSGSGSGKSNNNGKGGGVQALRKQWSKPIRVTNSRDNPLQIPIYKLQGGDGKGHWFGRRSVHEGLGFERWREKLSGEMGETLRRNQERVRKGKMPDQAVRGIGAERLVEGVEVMGGGDGGDGDGDGVIGRVQVYHVSAQFPKPTTARDFVSLIVSWDDSEGEEEKRKQEGKGREWMMVSRPCEHDEVPPVPGYIRGMYESVEFIREIPVEGKPEGAMNPVEWVMVTRSDPGGNIPRWMVEKGTPKSICTDAVKFLNWACRDGERKRRSTDRSVGSHSQYDEEEDASSSEEDSDDESYTEVEHHGLIASFAYLVNAGLERYAPQTVLDYLPQHSRQVSAQSVPASSTEPDVEGVKEHEEDAVSHDKASIAPSANSGVESSLEAGPDVSALELMAKNKKGKLTSHEKQLAKLAERKRNVEAQLDKVRADIQALRVTSPVEGSKRDKMSTTALAATNEQASSEPPSSSPASSMHKGQTSSKSRHAENPDHETAKMHKVASGLFHDESKLLKQLGKIEKDQVKEASKIEARQQKHADKQEKHRSRAETEALRREVEVLKKEVHRLRGERKQWLDLIGSLQNENTRLAAAQGGGNDKGEISM
ncbi:hypothetical protein BO83DRAFT_398448 [Aspergillus eucalypticola CBS 122712]|uniref:DUF3074 domain-containing protein n=1 Tax=Aspergillus eucalypticola (strain CBS 122712 / IBT 29274) TaxID=1448314 RepID=A0A317VLB9_ASPEC|nr:uncharacterized protein BO83DRAFT_398448 [Aspergillus eucalypticola CBS 122712]PWY74011.1 hypothetical protein BO83DRAFT_398448 [Aspergillus eucalypticola CBS 122712]